MMASSYARRLSARALFAAMLVAATTSAQASVEISSKPTHNMICTGGVCAPTAKNADLNATDLANMLATSNVKVVTGNGAVTITVTASFSWTSPNRLTLDAYYNVSFRAPVEVAGPGAVTIVTSDGGSGGDLIFFPGGKLDYWDSGSSLIINGKTHTLVKDIATLASVAVTGRRYALANDYDASVDGTYSSSPVARRFAGTFEGLGHEISNLSIGGAGGALFAQASGTLRDLRVTNLSINGTSAGAALVVTDYGVTIIGCYASGTIVAGQLAGGLIGTVRDELQHGIISRSHADISLTVSTYGEAGGLAGASGASIINSYATGSITGGDNAVLGGLVGYLTYAGSLSSISQSFADVSITGGEFSTIGGFVGENDGTIEDAYATGAVKGGQTSNIGGFAGILGGTIQYSYSTGSVEGYHSGGFLGKFFGDPRIWADYWDEDTSGQRHCYAGNKCGRFIRRLTTQKFLSGLPKFFDPNIWGQNLSINNGYPYLLANPPPQ